MFYGKLKVQIFDANHNLINKKVNQDDSTFNLINLFSENNDF